MMNHTDRCESHARVLEAKGDPLSVQMRLGSPQVSNSPLKCCLVFSSEIAGCASHPNTYREARSLTVNGKQYRPSFSRNCPL